MKASDFSPNDVRVLVVEDEAIVALDMLHTLRSMGYDTLGAVASGEEALHLAARTIPSVVLMDIRLEGEMDGVETASRLIEGFGVPVIFVTASTERVTLERALALKPLGFMNKPLDYRRLEALLQTVFS